MPDEIAPTMERALGAQTCVDQRTRRVNLITLVFQMTACAGLLVVLFAAVPVLTAWNGCRWGARCVRSMMTPAGRTVFTRMCSWRRAVYVFYLGTVASWTLERSFLRGDVLAPASSESEVQVVELRKSRAAGVLPKRLFVLSEPPLVTDQGRRASAIGDAA